MERSENALSVYMYFLNSYVFSSRTKVLPSLEINLINRDGNKYTFKPNRKKKTNMKLMLYPVDNIMSEQNKLFH